MILKAYSGFYYVQTKSGAVVQCSLRGKYRLTDQDFLPGDRVSISLISPYRGVIERVEPRRKVLDRPPVANPQQVILVMSLTRPVPDFLLLDRLLILAGVDELAALICFNKCDLVSPEEGLEASQPYRDLGYRVLATSAVRGDHIEQLCQALSDQLSVFAGPSGVGKSSLLNTVQPGLSLKTDEVGAKLQRGRHTTRHVELLPLSGGGWVADTPGFSRLDLPAIKREELGGYFPEINKLRGLCRFVNCLHSQEPECAVREAVTKGKLSTRRYKHYLRFLEEASARERTFR